MELGIISDIHGDLRALDTALERLTKYHHVQHILCAGDLIGRGPEWNAVVTRVREMGIIAVRGNHDEWDASLSPENAEFIQSLPIDWRGRFGSTLVYLCHGKPGNNLWGLYRDHISNTLLDMMLASLKVDVLVTGHTHVPLYARVTRGCAVNPGSLYTFKSARSTSHTYAVLSLPSLEFEVFDLTRPITEPMSAELYR